MKNKLTINTFSSLAYQISTVICGFIIPKMILATYGSEVNGLVNSITQFLQIVGFLDFGVGAVIQSALYKPLVEKNKNDLSKIIKSGSNYFKNIAMILLLYVCILIFLLPRMINSSFDTAYIVTLIVVIAVSSFAQFYFGVVNGILITADQKGYLKYNVQTITLIVNTLVCVLLLKLGATIQMVKLSTSLIYLLRPIYLCFYVKENYDIDRKIILDEEPIKQKKNGFAQHLAAFITGSTDTIVLTLFSGLTDVSVYSVYFLVINGLKQLIESLTSGIQVLLGKLWAENNIIEIKKYFFGVEWLTHFIVTIVFGATLILIIPFVLVYTQGINDVNYYVPAFSVSITFAYWIYCLRIPYNMMILVSGHYRETQKCFITSAIINIVSSVILVKIRGLVGVALGTMVAMIYQIVWLLKYNMKNIVLFGKSRVIRQLLNDVIISGISIIICLNFDRNCGAFIDWVKLAVKVVLTWIIISIIVNFVFFKKYIIKLYNRTIRERHNFE